MNGKFGSGKNNDNTAAAAALKRRWRLKAVNRKLFMEPNVERLPKPISCEKSEDTCCLTSCCWLGTSGVKCWLDWMDFNVCTITSGLKETPVLTEALSLLVLLELATTGHIWWRESSPNNETSLMISSALMAALATRRMSCSFSHFWRRKAPLGGARRRHFWFNFVLLFGLCNNGHAWLLLHWI